MLSKFVRSMAVAASVNAASWLICSTVWTRRPGTVSTALTTRPISWANSRTLVMPARVVTSGS